MNPFLNKLNQEDVDCGYLKEQELKSFLLIIEEWRSSSIRACNLGTHVFKITKYIAHINFEFLSSLSLNENEIESVEGVERMIMPNIVRLSLGNFKFMKDKIKSTEFAPLERQIGLCLKA